MHEPKASFENPKVRRTQETPGRVSIRSVQQQDPIEDFQNRIGQGQDRGPGRKQGILLDYKRILLNVQEGVRNITPKVDVRLPLSPGDPTAVLTSAVYGVYECLPDVQPYMAVYIVEGNTVGRANAAMEGHYPAIGVVHSLLSPGICRIQYVGELTGFTNLKVGETYYLCGHTGYFMTQLEPDLFVSQKIGWARNATTMVLNIDRDMVRLKGMTRGVEDPRIQYLPMFRDEEKILEPGVLPPDEDPHAIPLRKP